MVKECQLFPELIYSSRQNVNSKYCINIQQECFTLQLDCCDWSSNLTALQSFGRWPMHWLGVPLASGALSQPSKSLVD